MKKQHELTRDTIIQTIVTALKPLEYVHAFYEGGAAAFKRIDEWSDIDAYVVVDDDKVNETFVQVEKALKILSPIKQKLDVPQTPWQGVSQAFYKLEHASEYLIVDFVVLKLSSEEKSLDLKYMVILSSISTSQTRLTRGVWTKRRSTRSYVADLRGFKRELACSTILCRKR